jgi:hypothetical protein
MSDKFSGVPDRYVQGGKWVELKSLEYARGVVTYGAGMSIEQVRVCQELVDHQEEVWYMALVTTSRGQYVIWCPMWIVLEQEGNAFNCHEANEGWVYKYDGQRSITQNIPRDWR